MVFLWFSYGFHDQVTVDWTFTNSSPQPWPGCRLRFLGGTLRPTTSGAEGQMEPVPPRGIEKGRLYGKRLNIDTDIDIDNIPVYNICIYIYL